MKTLHLPHDLPSKSDTNLYYYQTQKASIKQRINLTKHVFSFLIEGQKEVFSSNTSLTIENSNFLLMKSGHCLMTEKLSPQRDYQSLLLFFSNDDVLQFIRKFNISTLLHTTAPSAFAFQYDHYINSYVSSLVTISKLPPSLQTRILPIKFEEIMMYLLERNGITFLNSIINQHHSNTLNFLNSIEANKLKKMTLKELAFLTNMSLSTFKRTFKKHFKQSPSKWFLDRRLEHSAFMLKKTHKTPSEIYESVGYENLSNFINAFKAKYGVTPKKYQTG